MEVEEGKKEVATEIKKKKKTKTTNMKFRSDELNFLDEKSYQKYFEMEASMFNSDRLV
jgi:hypothetical protein